MPETTKKAAAKKAPTAEEQQNAKPKGETIDAAKEYGQKAIDVTKDAAMGAFQAATVVVTDPMGGQSKAMNSLGPTKSLAAGIFFVALFVVINYFTSMRGSFADHMFLIGLLLVTPAVLMGSYWGLGQLYKKDVSIGGALFSTGVTLFPITVMSLLLWLNFFSAWIGGIIVLYGLVIAILLICGYLQDVLKASTQMAVVLTPTILTAVFVVLYIYIRLFGGNMFAFPGMGGMPAGMM